MPDAFVGLIIVGLIAGLASGLFGIGGGIIIVPTLITFLEFSQLNANGTSLASRLVPVGIFAALAYYRAGKLDLQIAIVIALGKVAGTFIGSKIALGLPTTTLQQIYAIFLLYMAWRFIQPLDVWRQYVTKAAPAAATATPSSGQEIADDDPRPAPYWLLLLGLVAGIAGGLFGIGGGIIIVPMLIAIFKFEQRRAVGTSLAALQFPADLPAVVNYYNAGNLEIGTAVFVGLGIIAGAFGGARIALGLPTATIRKLYGLFLFFVALRFLL